MVRRRPGERAGLRREVPGRYRGGGGPPGPSAGGPGQRGRAVCCPDAGLPGPWQREPDQRPRRGNRQLALAAPPRPGGGGTGGGDPQPDGPVWPLPLDAGGPGDIGGPGGGEGSRRIRQGGWLILAILPKFYEKFAFWSFRRFPVPAVHIYNQGGT